MADVTSSIVEDNETAVKTLLLNMIQKTTDKNNSLQWQMDLTITVKDILMNVGGYFYDGVSKKIIKYKEASLNATGLLRLSELLTAYLNKDTISSNLAMNEIGRIMEPINVYIPLEFYINRDDYGIDMKKYSATMWYIRDAIFLALKRAYDDGTRKHNETFLRYVENILTKDKDNKVETRNILQT